MKTFLRGAMLSAAVMLIAMVAQAQPSWTMESLGSFMNVSSIASTDMDGDGDLDILATSSLAEQIRWWENQQNDLWISHLITNSFLSPDLALPADIEGDGDVDVFAASSSTGDISVFVNQGDTVYIPQAIDGSFAGVRSLSPGDIDSDGLVDLVGASPSGDEIAWWKNSPLGWSKLSISNSFDGARAVTTVDVDQDGDIDVVGTSVPGDQIVWWENDLGWIQHLISGNMDAPILVSSGDVDLDGDPDLVAASTGQVVLFTNQGTFWSPELVHNSPESSIHSIGIGEIDRMPGLEITVSKGSMILWAREADSGWDDYPIAYLSGGQQKHVPVDINGDGNLDIVHGDWITSGIKLYLQEWEYSVNVESPAANDILFRNTPALIEWTSNFFEVVSIELFFEGDSLAEIAAGVENDGIFVWTVPDSLALSDDYRVVVEATSDPSSADASGAFSIVLPYFEIELTPDTMTVARGSTFEYSALLTSHLPTQRMVDVWSEAQLPDGNVFGPVWSIDDFPMGPNTVIDADFITQNVPLTAPLGQVRFRIKASTASGPEFRSNDIILTVVPALTADGAGSWETPPPQFGADEASTYSELAVMPDPVVTVHPNPFNAMATISINLPQAGLVQAALYDLLGRQVMVLADGHHDRGRHEIHLNSDGLASGIYFLRVQVSEQFPAVQKVMLLR